MKQSLANEGNSYIAPTINYAFLQNPSTRPFDNKGGYNMKIGRVQRNPLYEQLHNSDVNNVIRSLNTLKLTWHIWDGLSASGKLAYDYTAGTEDVLWDRYSGDERFIATLEERNQAAEFAIPIELHQVVWLAQCGCFSRL